jgi:Flp pilus assembly protein TadD
VSRRRDWRWIGLALTLGAVLAGGMSIGSLGPAHPALAVGASAGAEGDDLAHQFAAAVNMLRNGQHAQAASVLHRVIVLAPQSPEAHVNLGFAMLGLQRPALAHRAFERATELRPAQANAYYGLALASEAQGDLEPALGAMRSYLHLARAEDEAHLRRARAALWEWETRLAEERAKAGR